jgi:hypothetical protein
MITEQEARLIAQATQACKQGRAVSVRRNPDGALMILESESPHDHRAALMYDPAVYEPLGRFLTPHTWRQVMRQVKRAEELRAARKQKWT